MKLVINLKLQVSPEQAETLRRTLTRANQACNWISKEAWRTKTFKQFRLHGLTYYRVREQFGLSSQMAVRAVSKVADAYKLDTKTPRTFRPLGAIAYDDRILSFKLDDKVSLWTVDGRRTLRFECGEYQRKLLPHRKGELELMLVRGSFYLGCVCDVEEPPLGPVDSLVGVDFGIVNLATTSEGDVFSGKEVERVRIRHQKLRSRLQKAADTKKNRGDRPKNIRRRLKRLSGKQARFQKDTNHCISKKLVAVAEGTKRAIALENLKGIRARTRFGREQRARMGNWAFAQLGLFVAYKAARAGVPLEFVDPRHTSQTCHVCGHRERANRKSQAEFECRRCGHRANADVNAALNIRARAAVNRPKVAEQHSVSPAA